MIAKEKAMNFIERLKDLVDHEVSIAVAVPDDEQSVPAGILEEVGDDYLIVKTEERKDGEITCTSTQWIVSLFNIIHLIHRADCRKCATDETTRKLEGILGDTV